MARQPRREEAGGIYHVYARGNDKQRVFADDTDRVRYLALLGREVHRQGWNCLAYCLMPNHVHLLVRLAATNLGVGMQRLHGDYARTYNDRHHKVGHLFQGRYGAVKVETDRQLLIGLRYLAENPLKAGLCEHPATWRWGSHGAIANGRPPAWLDAGLLYGLLDLDGDDAAARYLALVAGVASRAWTSSRASAASSSASG